MIIILSTAAAFLAGVNIYLGIIGLSDTNAYPAINFAAAVFCGLMSTITVNIR